MKNRLIDRKTTKQVLIDAGMHKLLKIKATEAGTTIRAILEEFLMEVLEVKTPSQSSNDQ